MTELPPAVTTILRGLPAQVLLYAQGFDVRDLVEPMVLAASLGTDVPPEALRQDIEVAIMPLLLEEAKRRGLERASLVQGRLTCRWCPWSTAFVAGAWAKVHAHQLDVHEEVFAGLALAAELADVEAGTDHPGEDEPTS